MPIPDLTPWQIPAQASWWAGYVAPERRRSHRWSSLHSWKVRCWKYISASDIQSLRFLFTPWESWGIYKPIGSVCMPTLMVCHLPSIYPGHVGIDLPYIRIRHGKVGSPGRPRNRKVGVFFLPPITVGWWQLRLAPISWWAYRPFFQSWVGPYITYTNIIKWYIYT